MSMYDKMTVTYFVTVVFMLITPKLKIQRSISQASRSERVALSIRERILGGHYKPGAMLPGRRALAAEYEVAPLTIEQAFKNLQGEGLVRSENGRGTFVSDLVSVTPAQFSNVKRSISTRPTTRSIGIVTGGRQMMELIGAKHQRMRIVRSMEQALSRANCMVKFVNGCDEIGNRRGRYEILDDIAEQNLDAIAFVMAEEEFGDVIKSSELKRIPVVLAGNPHFIHAPSVFYDGRDADANG
jgi:DNA-binding transcriptional regulator YhcF (GntR family)